MTSVENNPMFASFFAGLIGGGIQLLGIYNLLINSDRYASEWNAKNLPFVLRYGFMISAYSWTVPFAVTLYTRGHYSFMSLLVVANITLITDFLLVPLYP